MDFSMDSKKNVLVVDDEKSILTIIGRTLEKNYSIFYAQNGQEALTIFNEEEISLVITDISMPIMDGLTLLQKIKSLNQDVPVIMITGHDHPRFAEKAFSNDVFDFIQKPIESHLINIMTSRAIEKFRLLKEINKLKTIKSERDEINIVGQSKAVKELLNRVEEVAKLGNTSILIIGETGTGKELMARAIHEKSNRSTYPFLSVDCTLSKGERLEAILFGHEKGAFASAETRQLGVIESADGGTLFINEISEMGIEIQTKFLRFLDSHGFFRLGGNKLVKADVRILAATNRSLENMVAKKEFRDDLHRRLSEVTLKTPSLFERGKGDIKLLIDYYLEKFEREIGNHTLGFGDDAMNALMEYKWPGNIRELRNVVERLTLLNNDKRITSESLPEDITIGRIVDKMTTVLIPHNISYSDATKLFEKVYFTSILNKTLGDITQASKIAGMDESDFATLLKKHQIIASDYKPEMK